MGMTRILSEAETSIRGTSAMRKLATLATFPLFVVITLTGLDVARADISERVIVVHGEPGGGVVLLTSPPFSELTPLCEDGEDYAGCLNELFEAFDCKIDNAAPPFLSGEGETRTIVFLDCED